MYVPKVYKLNSGLTVVIDSFNHVETASLGLFSGVGSRIENKNNNGICHFLEHMVFKGTKTRDMYQISEEIESKGGIINAWTSKDKTAWYTKVVKEDSALATDVIFDIVYNSIFPENELEKEKKVVIEEIKQSYDDPDDLIYNYFQSICYSNNSLALTILGTEETVSNISKADLIDHLDKYYTNNNMVFVATGNVNEEKILEQLNKINFTKNNAPNINFTKAQHSNAKGVLLKDNLAQTQCIVSYPSVNLLDNNYYSYAVLSAVLGRGMSSRLFKEIREKRGLVYSIYSFLTAYKDVGGLAVQAACSYNNIKEVINLITEEANKLAVTLIADDELLKAKKQLISSLYMSLESSYSRAERWAYNILNFNNIINPKDTSDKINSVTKEDILNAAKTLISNQPVVAVLSSKELEL